MAQLPRDVGEARAEHEHRHAVAVVGDRVQEVQEHARVRVHRARDVAQHDERRVQLARRGAHERDDVAAFAQAFRRRLARRSMRCPRRCGWKRRVRIYRQRQAQLGDHLLRLGELRRRHGVEVHALQHLARGEGEPRLELEPLLRLRPRRFWLKSASVRRWLCCCSGLGARPWALRQQQLHHPLGELRVAPEDAGTPGRRSAAAPGATAAPPTWSSTSLRAAAGIRAPAISQRLHAVDHAVGADAQAGGAQQAREVHHVFRQPARQAAALSSRQRRRIRARASRRAGEAAIACSRK